jgi:hypothetical protein
MSARFALRLALVIALVAMSALLSGCVFFSNAFWLCATGDSDGCEALSEYLKESAADWDGDGFENGSDECDLTRDTAASGVGCPDGDTDGVPDYRDSCPGVHGDGHTTGCPGPAAPGDTEPPPAPTGVTADGQGSRIRLDWFDVICPDCAGYHVERATRSGGPYTRITPSPLTTSKYDDSPIADPNQTYYYVVTAVDTSGNVSPRSDEVSAKGCEPPECTPSGPGGLAHISLATARHAYRANVRGRFVRVRSFAAENGVLTGRRLVFTGRLAAARGAPAGLGRASWTARLDLSLSTPTSTATARGVALARFGRAGRICLRFTQRMSVGGPGRRVLRGSFSVIGATGRARQLGSASRFSGKAGRGSAWTLRASGSTGKRLPRALPRACRGL